MSNIPTTTQVKDFIASGDMQQLVNFLVASSTTTKSHKRFWVSTKAEAKKIWRLVMNPFNIPESTLHNEHGSGYSFRVGDAYLSTDGVRRMFDALRASNPKQFEEFHKEGDIVIREDKAHTGSILTIRRLNHPLIDRSDFLGRVEMGSRSHTLTTSDGKKNRISGNPFTDVKKGGAWEFVQKHFPDAINETSDIWVELTGFPRQKASEVGNPLQKGQPGKKIRVGKKEKEFLQALAKVAIDKINELVSDVNKYEQLRNFDARDSSIIKIEHIKNGSADLHIDGYKFIEFDKKLKDRLVQKGLVNIFGVYAGLTQDAIDVLDGVDWAETPTPLPDELLPSQAEVAEKIITEVYFRKLWDAVKEAVSFDFREGDYTLGPLDTVDVKVKPEEFKATVTYPTSVTYATDATTTPDIDFRYVFDVDGRMGDYIRAKYERASVSQITKWIEQGVRSLFDFADKHEDAGVRDGGWWAYDHYGRSVIQRNADWSLEGEHDYTFWDKWEPYLDLRYNGISFAVENVQCTGVGEYTVNFTVTLRIKAEGAFLNKQTTFRRIGSTH